LATDGRCRHPGVGHSFVASGNDCRGNIRAIARRNPAAQFDAENEEGNSAGGAAMRTNPLWYDEADSQ
jgi:hypothetical protein